MKLSALQSITDGSDDSLLMLSYSTDGGQTYETRAIKFEDFADDIELDDLKNVSVENPATGQVLSWNGTAWAPSDAQPAIQTSKQLIENDFVIATGENGASFGTVAVDQGVTVTVSGGSTWHVLA